MAREYNALTLVMTATLSLAAGAGLVFLKNKEKLDFADE